MAQEPDFQYLTKRNFIGMSPLKEATVTPVSVYAGAAWIQSNLGPGKLMSEIGVKAADLLGDLFLGIYHLDMKEIDSADWTNHFWIQIKLRSIGHNWATHDGDLLTRLVLLAHDRCIRVSIEPTSKHYLLVQFHSRQRTGPMGRRHPTLEEHITQLRAAYGEPTP